MFEVDYEKSSGVFTVEIDNAIHIIEVQNKGDDGKNFLLEYIIKKNIKQGSKFAIKGSNIEIKLIEFNCNIVTKNVNVYEKKLPASYNPTKNNYNFSSFKFRNNFYNNLKDNSTIDITKLNYLYFYYPKNSPKFNEFSQVILDVFKKEAFTIEQKNRKNNFYNEFYKYCILRLKDIYSMPIILSVVPGHADTMVIDNTITSYVKFLSKKEPNNFIDGSQILLREYSIEKSSTSKETRTIEKQYNSLKINGDCDIRGKVILLIDDIYTSGSTMLACKKLLEENGAQRIIMFSFSKTNSL